VLVACTDLHHLLLRQGFDQRPRCEKP
jgi:hypothetical protein